MKRCASAQMSAWKAAPALAAGCTVVLKPSENAPLTTQALADMATAAGVPPGVLNVLTGLGADAGAPLAAHPGVDKLAFTGSVATGKRIMAAAAERVCPVSLELGGKSPLLVFDDAAGEEMSDDALDRIAEWVMFGAFLNAGQVCSATTRLLLQRRIAAPLLARLKAHAEAVAVGDPLLPGTRLGPLVSAAQHARVARLIATAHDEGAALLTGGGRPKGLAGDAGFFVAPTIFTGVTPAMTLWREEVFGPVLAVAEFDSEAEALALANDSEYGLAAAVITGDAQRASRLAEELQAGIVWLQCSQPAFVQAPWGGVKRSGFGSELGPEGIHNFLVSKQVTTYTQPGKQFGYYASFGA
jgi:betaine-aldehyde dehydrogenase